MDQTELNVVNAPKDSVFQVRINKELRMRAEQYCNQAGLTLTDAFNMMVQYIISEKRVPWVSNPGQTILQDQALRILQDYLDTAKKSISNKSYTQEELSERFGV